MLTSPIRRACSSDAADLLAAQAARRTGGPAAAVLSQGLTGEDTAAVPISVTSRFHFFEANPRLRFDRAAAYGMHLAVAARAASRCTRTSARTRAAWTPR